MFRKTPHDPKLSRPNDVCDASCRVAALRDRMLTSAAERLRI